MPAGRPPMFDSPDKMAEMVQEYFDNLPVRKVAINGVMLELPTPTISGLAMHLGFDSRQSFYDYEQKPEFTYTIKRARLFIEHEYEKGLHSGSPTGSIFALKNFGWKDKTEQEMSGSLDVNQLTEAQIDARLASLMAKMHK